MNGTTGRCQRPGRGSTPRYRTQWWQNGYAPAFQAGPPGFDSPSLFARLAQPGQSTWFTPRVSGVRLPHCARGEAEVGPCVQSRALHALVLELVDNLVSETRAGNRVRVRLPPDARRCTHQVKRPACQAGEAGSSPVTCAEVSPGEGDFMRDQTCTPIPASTRAVSSVDRALGFEPRRRGFNSSTARGTVREQTSTRLQSG